MNIAKRILLSSILLINVSQPVLRADFVAMVQEEAGKHLNALPKKVWDAAKSGIHKGLYESLSSYKSDAIAKAILKAKGMPDKSSFTAEDDQKIANAANEARKEEYRKIATFSAAARRSAITAAMLMDDYLLTSSDSSVLDKVGMSCCKLAETELGHYDGWHKEIKIENGEVTTLPNEGPLLKLKTSLGKVADSVWNKPMDRKSLIFNVKSLLWLARVGLSVGDVKARRALQSGDLASARFATRFIIAAAADYAQDALGTCIVKSIVDGQMPKTIFSAK